MSTVDLTVACPLYASFRTAQVAGMFDVPLVEKLRERFSVELPDENEAWRVGLIVGPSGSGKSSVARAVYKDCVWREADWPKDRAVIDGFGDLPTKTIVRTLTAVGFSSPPSWVKPYHVLSNGERSRCELARALLSIADCRLRNADQKKNKSAIRNPQSQIPLVVFDEFTSVVDRDVAKVCSAAVAKAIRRGHLDLRFVAVTCHSDVAEWLEADWVLDMATGQVSRRRLRRPPIELTIHRAGPAAWRVFARHHYLSGLLARGARCYIARWRGEPVAFAATLPIYGKKAHWRFTRIVTLPDYQGVGIGMALVETVADLHREAGIRINLTTSHPAMIAHCRRSQRWRCVTVKKQGATQSPRGARPIKGSHGRAVVSFEYVHVTL